MKAAIYARKSRATEKGESVEHQITRGISYCESQGWEYTVYCDYDFSGGYINRPEFKKMMENINKGEYVALVCYKLNRVCRNMKDFVNLFDHLSQIDVSFVSIKENFDTSTSIGRASMYFSAIMSQLERENISEAVLDNMFDRAKEGKWNGGPVPIGYDVVKIEGQNFKGNKIISSKLVINDEESKIVKLIYDEYLQPDGSIRSITKKLILLGYKTKKNNTWRANQINRILKNALYCIADEDAYRYFNDDNNPIIAINEHEQFDGEHGLMYYGRRKPKNNTTTKPAEKQDWILSIGEHQGIIPGEIFVSVQKKINLNYARLPRLGTSTKSPLTGLVRCSKCQSPMTVSISKKNSKNKNEDGYSYIYFMCRKSSESSSLLCPGTRINAKYLENRILEHLIEVFTDKEKLDSILHDYKNQIQKNKVEEIEIEEKQLNIKKELQNIEKGIENLLNALADNVLPANLIKQKYAEFVENKELLSNELTKLGLQLLDNDIKVNSQYIIDVLQKIKPTDLDDMNFDIRKNFYHSIIKHIYVSDTDIEIQIFLSVSNGLLICPRRDMDSLKQPS